MEQIQQNSDKTSGNSRASRMGLVCHYQFENGLSQFCFLHLDNNSGGISLNYGLSFSTENYVQMLSSCNGWLLLSSIAENNQLMYHLFNPLTRETIRLPQPRITGCVIRSGLASESNHHQVVLVHIPNSFSDGLELEIFSSETGNWRRYTPFNLVLPFGPPEDQFPELTPPPLFSNGSINWEICGHLLVYNVQNDHCKLIKLPNVFEDWCWQSTMTYKRCLWESGGLLHYSYTDFDGVHTWNLLRVQDNIDDDDDDDDCPWKLADCLYHHTLESNYPKIFLCRSVWEPHHLSPVAYNEDSQTMYMQLPGMVISYNTNTRVLEEVCTYKFPGENFSCCSFFPFVYSGPGNLQNVDEASETQTAVELPIDGLVSSLIL